MGAWLKQSLAGMTDSLLSKEVVERRGLFRYEAVNGLVDAHRRNIDDHTDHLQALTNLEIFSRVFIDGRSVDDVTVELQRAERSMKILYVCHRVPYPPQRGGKIRPFNMISHFSRKPRSDRRFARAFARRVRREPGLA